MTQKTQFVIAAKDETGAAISSAKRGLDSLATSGKNLNSSLSFLSSAGGLAGVLGGAGLASAFKSAVDGMDQLNDAAERVGVSVEDLSALNFAGKMNGIEFEDMTTALTKLSVKMQEAASGGKEAGALFADLGIKVTDSSGKLKTADAVFAEIATSFEGMEDGAGKTALAVDVFGKSGAKLVPILNGGAKGLAEMRQEAESLGGIIDGKLAKQAAEFNDNLDKLSVLSAAAGRSIASELLPTLNRLTEEFLIGIKNSDGFLDAMYKYGLTNPFASPAESLAKLNKEATELEDKLSIGRGSASDEKRLKSLQQQLNYYSEIDKLKNPKAAAESSAEKNAVVRTPTKPATEKKGSKSIDEALRLIQSLDEQIALKGADLSATDKLSEAEKQAVKIRYQLEAGTLKATDAQKASINTSLDSLITLEKEIAGRKEFADALAKSEEAAIKGRNALRESVEQAERAAEVYGLTESQISAVEQARLSDAIAMARENGASEDQLEYLEEELALRAQLSDALIKGDNKRIEQATKATDEMDEFAKSAAKNIQSAMADFLFDPFADGADKMAEKFGKLIQRMIADAAAAQLAKSLFGDLAGGKSGDSGLVGAAGSFLSSVDWASIFAFEDGGIMTKNGAMPLRKYAMGGIANSPQMAMFGEGSTPEAYVPLPDGRSIPVKMAGQGGGNNITIHVNSSTGDAAEIRRSTAAGARSALSVMNGARRYG